MTATAAQRIAALRLARCEGVGPVTFAQLLSRFGSPEAAVEALPRLAARGGRTGLTPPSIAQVERELSAGEALGARLLVLGEQDFPPQLAALDPPPPTLWVWGDAALLSRPAVAVVGARVASAAGQRFARGLAAELCNAGLTVVSGLARGIDGAAHEGALQAAEAASTVAVLAGGVDDIYPPEHHDLHGRIVAAGAVVSESAIGRRAKAQDFPRRNRIISGLAQAVVVVEAELRSGSLITARLAGEQGREVLAVPGSPLDPRARGCNDLIRQGAALCEGLEDVLRVLSDAPRSLREPGRSYAPLPLDASADREIEAVRERVAAMLSPTPVAVDEIARACGAPAAIVSAALMELCLAGRAELAPGGMATST